jgi:hypothetical protein
VSDDLLRELFLGDGPSGMVGRFCRICAWRTCIGFFFCNFTVAERFGTCLRVGEELSGKVDGLASSCSLSLSKCSGVDIPTVFFSSPPFGLSSIFFRSRGFGTSVGDTGPSCGCTYGLVSGIDSSIDVNSLTAAECPEPMCMWLGSSS